MRRFVLNNVIKLKRMLYMEVVRLYHEKHLKDKLPKLPKKLIPDEKGENRTRIFYEREILKEKIKFVIGLDYDKTKELELYEIVEQMDKIIANTSNLISRHQKLGVIKEICNDCPGGRYYVTDLCRNCIAHSCIEVCPKNVISIVNNRAYINHEKCIRCGLCASACPYGAIIKLERPCEKSCVPKALGRTEKSPIEIKYEKCTACGACVIACPFGALDFPSQLLQVIHKLATGENMIAIFAPSIVSQFGRKVSVSQFKKALELLGFKKSYEVAIGADLVSKKEAEHFLKHGGPMLTSCCPSYVQFVKNEYSELTKYVSPIDSPMVLIAKKLKDEFLGHSIVFIGPCLAKKVEAVENNVPEFVLTFEEIAAAFAALRIEPAECEPAPLDNASSVAWGFAVSGGVGEAVRYYVKKLSNERKSELMNITVASGLEECKLNLGKLLTGKIDTDLIEGMACDGGCIAGPGVLADPRIAKSSLSMFIKNEVKEE